MAETNQWFTEAELPYTAADVRIQVGFNEKLFDQQSPFGHVEVFDTDFHGRMMTLDGIIQVAEKDEFIYHEMMVALPGIKHGAPKTALIIGGGDGGAVKQALKFKSMQRVVLVEIDRLVIDVCEEYMPSIADGALEDPRVEVVIADGMEYVKNATEQFDIIALDLTDPLPDGPAAGLYEEPFYQNVRKLLTENGMVSAHCSSLVIQPEEARTMLPRLRKVFPHVELHSAVIPTYQLTSFGFLIAQNKPDEPSKETVAGGFENLTHPPRYLSPGIFVCSTELPPYLKEKIGL